MKRRLPFDVLGMLFLLAVCGAAYWQRSSPPKPLPRALIAADPRAAIEAEESGAVEGASIATEMRLEYAAGDAAGSELNRQGVELAQQNRFGEAVGKLRAALRAAPTSNLIRRNLQAVLAAWGFQEMQRHQWQAAADHFQEASTFGPEAQILTGLGIVQVHRQQYDDAIAALEDAIQHGAKDGATFFALGEAYEATDDRVRALEMLQRAREAGVRSPALQERLDRLGREVDAEWDFREESSRHFQVRFDDGEDRRAAASVLHSLEAAYDVVGRKFGYFPERPAPVVLYAEQDFHHITQTPDWAGAMFDGRLKFPVRGLEEGEVLDRVTRHEYAHNLIAALSRNRAPAWLNEGLAMWAEEESPGDRRAWAEEALAAQPLLPLSALVRPFAGLPRERVQAAYAQSYLTVLFLVGDYDARRITPLLEALHRQGSLDDAFADVYPIGFERFEKLAAEKMS